MHTACTSETSEACTACSQEHATPVGEILQYRQTTSFHYLTRPEVYFITLNRLNYRFPPRQTVTTKEAIFLPVLWFSTGQLLKCGASRELLWVPSKTWSFLCRGVFSGWSRCAPCETEHDVTFSRSSDQGKITKTLWIYLCIIQPEGVRHMYVLDCSRHRGTRRGVRGGGWPPGL